MNPEIKDKWLTALRSGDYFQGRSYLKVESGGVTRHCCLGILCDIAVAEGVDISIDKENQTYSFDGNVSALPISAQRWAGINNALGDFYLTDNPTNLAHLNDNGNSFADIADIIERHF